MKSPDDRSSSKPIDPGHFEERSRENARLIERAEQALQAITRTIEETRSVMRSGESNSEQLRLKLQSRFGMQAEKMLERVVFDLIGMASHDPASRAHASSTAQQAEAPRRPGRYRQLI